MSLPSKTRTLHHQFFTHFQDMNPTSPIFKTFFQPLAFGGRSVRQFKLFLPHILVDKKLPGTPLNKVDCSNYEKRILATSPSSYPLLLFCHSWEPPVIKLVLQLRLFCECNRHFLPLLSPWVMAKSSEVFQSHFPSLARRGWVVCESPDHFDGRRVGEKYPQQ